MKRIERSGSLESGLRSKDNVKEILGNYSFELSNVCSTFRLLRNVSPALAWVSSRNGLPSSGKAFICRRALSSVAVAECWDYDWFPTLLTFESRLISISNNNMRKKLALTSSRMSRRFQMFFDLVLPSRPASISRLTRIE